MFRVLCEVPKRDFQNSEPLVQRQASLSSTDSVVLRKDKPQE